MMPIVGVLIALVLQRIAQKTAPPHYQGPLQIQVGQYMEMVAIDYMGPFPKNQNGNHYILVVEDY